MTLAYALLLCLHLLAAALWVGGMAVMLGAVRPAAVAVLEPPQRLALMAAALGRFFKAVAAAIAVLLLSGAAMIVQAGGMGQVPWRVHAMLAIGLLMMALFGHLRFSPYPRLLRAVAARDGAAAAASLAGIRKLVTVNLALGVLVFGVAVVGRAL